MNIDAMEAHLDEGGKLSHENAVDLFKEASRLREELGKAYRALHGFYNSSKKGELLGKAATSYHSPTIAAAKRFVDEDSLEGSQYFEGKSILVLQDYI